MLLSKMGKTAVIEVANIIGLSMHPREKRAPLYAGSYGVGTVMLDAIEKGCKKIIVGWVAVQPMIVG